MKPDHASNTALIVAAGVQVLAHDARFHHLLPPALARHGRRILQASHPCLLGLLGKPWFRQLCYLLESITLPGILQHYVLRKAMIREYVAQAIAGGVRQIVVLGAGYDSLCQELADLDNSLTLIEIDHPATQANKRDAVSTLTGNRVHYIASDLNRHDLISVLLNCPAFKTSEHSLFIAEGLLMYLPITQIQALLEQIKNTATQTSLIFSWMELQQDGQANFRPSSKLVDFCLRQKNEPFLSGMPQGEVGPFLQMQGYRLLSLRESSSATSHYSAKTLAEHQLKPIDGEYICLAQAIQQSR